MTFFFVFFVFMLFCFLLFLISACSFLSATHTLQNMVLVSLTRAPLSHAPPPTPPA